MELEELIEEIIDIKKALIHFEENVRRSNDVDGETFADLIGYKECAYDDLSQIKDILSEMESKKKELEDKGE